MFDFSYLEGQPPWVVVVVVALVLTGTIGWGVLRHRLKLADAAEEIEPASEPPALPRSDGAVDALRAAMDHLVEQARENAGEANEALRENRVLTRQNTELQLELVRLRDRVEQLGADYAECRAEVADLVQRHTGRELG